MRDDGIAPAGVARRRRILCSDHGVVASGDANPWAYALHDLLRAEAFDSRLVHLLTEPEAWYFRYRFGNDCDDPDQVGGVQRCIVTQPVAQRQAALADLIEAFEPELLVAWGTTAARALRRAAPTLPLVLMVSRCARLEELIDQRSVRDFVAYRAAVQRGVVYPRSNDHPELDAFAGCDLAIAPSELARFTYEHFYRAHIGKMYGRPLAPSEWVQREAERFEALRRPFERRDIDVIVVAASWDIAARNLRLTAALCRRLRSRNVHIVGECRAWPPAYTHGALPRRSLFELLGRAKVAVFPGLADAAPGGMLEAAAMGCNVVASPNAGFYELCHDDLRVPTPSVAAFLERIELALARPLTDGRERFGGDSAELIETLVALLPGRGRTQAEDNQVRIRDCTQAEEKQVRIVVPDGGVRTDAAARSAAWPAGTPAATSAQTGTRAATYAQSETPAAYAPAGTPAATYALRTGTAEIPEVTVAMPARNAGGFIRQAIESVLAQEGIDLELIVVDDHSEDDTAAVAESVRDARLTVLRNPRRRGIGACHNIVVRRSRAPYIAHVDADDVVIPGALRKLVDALAGDADLAQSHCYFFNIDARGHTTRDGFVTAWHLMRRRRPPTLDYRAELSSHSVANALRTFRRTALVEVGAFDEQLPYGVDYDMALRIIDRFRITLVPEFLYARRIHGRNTTEGLRFQALRLWWIKYRIRRQLIRSRRIAFIRDPGLDLFGFLHSRWNRMLARVRAAVERGARRSATFVRWRAWAPCAAMLHRRAARHLRWWPLAWSNSTRMPAAGAPHLVYYLQLFPALSETFIQREVAALLDRGAQLDIVAEEPYGAEHFDDEARRLAARTVHLGLPTAGSTAAPLRMFLRRRPWTVLNLLAYLLVRTHRARKSFVNDRATWRRAVRLAGVLAERGATHVHAPWATGDALVAMVAARLARVRYTVQARASDLHKHTSQPGLDERLRHADFIVTNAQYNVPVIRATLPGGATAPVHTIYEGVDVALLTPGRRSRYSGETALILSVARLVEPKGIDVLLQACRILKDRGLAFRCEIVGARAPAETGYYIELMKLWRKLGLEDQVHFLGTRSFAGVREKYEEADIYVLAAVPASDGRRDVTPNTVIEAMAMGLAVVSTRSGAIPELIEDGVSGVLVPPRDEVALADAMECLLGDGELRRRLGSAARHRAEERFDIEKNAARYAELFGFTPTARRLG